MCDSLGVAIMLIVICAQVLADRVRIHEVSRADT